MPRLFTLVDYWKEYPPTSVSVGSLIKAFSSGGKKSKGRGADKHGNPIKYSPDNIIMAAQQMGGTIHIMRPKIRPWEDRN